MKKEQKKTPNKIKDEIKKDVLMYTEEVLADFDFDYYFEPKRIKSIVDTYLKDIIANKLTEVVHERIYTRIKKVIPIIDAGIEGKVNGFMYGFEEYLKQYEKNN